MRTKTPIEQAVEALEYIRDHARSTSPELLSKYAEDGIAALRQPSPSVDMEAMAKRWAEANGEGFAMNQSEYKHFIEMLAAFAKYVLEARPSAGEEGEQWIPKPGVAATVEQMHEPAPCMVQKGIDKK